MKDQCILALKEAITELVLGKGFEAVDKIMGVIIILQKEGQSGAEQG